MSKRKRKSGFQDDFQNFTNNFDILRSLSSTKRRRSGIHGNTHVETVLKEVTTQEPHNSIEDLNLKNNGPRIKEKVLTTIEDTEREVTTQEPQNLSNDPWIKEKVLPTIEDTERDTDSVFKVPATPFKRWKNTLRGKVRSSIRRRQMKSKGLHDYSLSDTMTDEAFFGLMIDGKPRGKKDEELQHKIDHEIKMRDGTAKLLAASKQPAQMLEAAKSLLASNARMIAYMSELQKRRTDEAFGRKRSSAGDQLPCKARVAVSDIRIPLMWKDSDHFKNKGDHRRYVVFCLVKIGTEIYDTSLIKDVDRSMTDICFEDCIVFHNIPETFECRLEIYCHKLCEDMSLASSHKKMKKKIDKLSGSIGKSVGRRLSGLSDSDILSNMIVGPKYDNLGHATMKVSDVCDSINTFDLALEDPQEGATELPLFGNFCCRLAAQPYCLIEDTCSGYLFVEKVDDEDASIHWVKHWCVLKNLAISCWDCQEDEEWRVPVLTIPVTKDSQIMDADPSVIHKPHTFHVISCEYGSRKQYTLAAECSDELQKWWEGLQQHLLDQVVWKDACDSVMKIKPSNQKRISLGRKASTSLYDDTPAHRSPPRQKKISKLIPPQSNKSNGEFSPLTMMLKKYAADDDELDLPVTRQRSRDSGISSS